MDKPRRINVDGDRYDVGVLLVTSRDALGRPLTARFVHEDDSVNLRELQAEQRPVEFITAYFNRDTWGAPQKGPSS